MMKFSSVQPEMVSMLHRLVLAESPSNVPDSQVHCLSMLLEELQSIDYQVELIRGRQTGGHLLGRPKMMAAETPRQLLLGHCDTVWPIGTLKQMPFVVDGNIVKGPGVYDMKGGVAQALLALQTLQHFGIEPEVVPHVFLNSDEEIGSKDSRRYIERLAACMDRVFVLATRTLHECGPTRPRRSMHAVMKRCWIRGSAPSRASSQRRIGSTPAASSRS